MNGFYSSESEKDFKIQKLEEENAYLRLELSQKAAATCPNCNSQFQGTPPTPSSPTWSSGFGETSDAFTLNPTVNENETFPFHSSFYYPKTPETSNIPNPLNGPQSGSGSFGTSNQEEEMKADQENLKRQAAIDEWNRLEDERETERMRGVDMVALMRMTAFITDGIEPEWFRDQNSQLNDLSPFRFNEWCDQPD